MVCTPALTLGNQSMCCAVPESAAKQIVQLLNQQVARNCSSATLQCDKCTVMQQETSLSWLTIKI